MIVVKDASRVLYKGNDLIRAMDIVNSISRKFSIKIVKDEE